MTIAESLLPELDQELASTRRLLERVPDAHADWRPHPRSWPLGGVAIHLANLLTWAPMTLDRTELDLNPPGGEPFTPPVFTTAAELVSTFDRNAAAARAAIAGAADADFFVPWTLKSGGQELLTLPRIAVLRSFVLNHLIHHRGQLTVYLRMKDVPLPAIYGPTADDPGGM